MPISLMYMRTDNIYIYTYLYVYINTYIEIDICKHGYIFMYANIMDV